MFEVQLKTEKIKHNRRHIYSQSCGYSTLLNAGSSIPPLPDDVGGAMVVGGGVVENAKQP